MTTAAVATGRSTLTLLFNMGVMTMNMIRSTSITSTIGVTLMLELTFLPSSRLLIPMLYAPSCSQRPVSAYGLQPLHPLSEEPCPPDAVRWRHPEDQSKIQ